MQEVFGKGAQNDHGRVIGIGIDLCEIERVRSSLERYGSRFLDRVFTPEEQHYCMAKRSPAESLAARFAAKEADGKALGTGLSRGIAWHHLEVRREEGEAPQLRFSGPAADLAEQLQVRRVLLSLTHAGRYAQAMVLLES